MRRREFIASLGAVACCSSAAPAQQARHARVGYVAMGKAEGHLPTPHSRAFHAEMESLGWRVGRNLHIDYRFADDDPGRAEGVAREIVAAAPDVVFVGSRPLLPRVARATSTLPVVFMSLGDPVAEGWVKSYSRPGGNLTGVAGLSPDLAGKRLQLLRDVVPGLARIAVLWNVNNRGEEIAAKAIRDAGQALGLAVMLEPVHGPGDVERALAAAAQGGARAVVVLPDPTFQAERAAIVDLIARAALPAVYTEEVFVRDGGLMSYSSSLEDLYKIAARHVAKILGGAKPADLPVEQPTRFDLVLNLRTARELGLEFPPAMLASAEEVVE